MYILEVSCAYAYKTRYTLKIIPPPKSHNFHKSWAPASNCYLLDKVFRD